MHEANEPIVFLPFLIILLLAFGVPILLARVRGLPVVVGEIIAGVLVGPSVLGWVSVGHGEIGQVLTFMSDTGLAFLMFLAGLEIDLQRMFSRQGRAAGGVSPLRTAALIYLLTFALSIPAGFLANRFGLAGDPWLLAFILGATSLGVLLPILKDRDMFSGVLGQVVFITASLADFLTVILLTVYVIVMGNGFQPQIFAIGLLFIAFLFFYRFGPSFVRLPGVQQFFTELSKSTVQIKVRGAIAILMAFVVLAEFVQAELILGAFLAGMIISLLKGPEDEGLVHKLEAFGFGFFIPIFFVLVGVNLDIPALFVEPEGLLALPGFLLLSILVKTVPTWVALRGFSFRERVASGLLLNTHLSLEIAVAVIGQRAGLFSPATSTAVILFAVLTVVLMPFLFGVLLPYVPKSIERFILIIGESELGLKVAQELRAHGDRVRFWENRPAELARIQAAGFDHITGSPEPGALDGLPAPALESVLVLGENDEENLRLGRAVASQPVRNVIALVKDPQLLPRFQDAGVKPFSTAIERTTMLAMMARNPDALTLLTSTSDNRQIQEVTLRNRSLAGRELLSLRLPGDFLVLAIRRDAELIVPRGATRLEYGDRLTLMGNIDDLAQMRPWLENERSGSAARPAPGD